MQKTALAGACDTHLHVYDPNAVPVLGARLCPSDATLAEYQRVQKALGLTRCVFIQPSAYGTDNSVMAQALRELGPTARGIAVVDHTVTNAELDALDSVGVRGTRVLYGRGDPVPKDAIEPLAHRLAERGWHMQFFMSAARLLDIAPILERLPVDIVLDHFAHLPPRAEPGSPAAQTRDWVSRMLDKGRTWLKVSGAYITSERGAPDFDDVGVHARQYIQRFPERVLWGSNWPHPAALTGETAVPDDAQLLDLAWQWAQTDALRERLFVTNPEALFGFDPQARPSADGGSPEAQ